MEQNSSVISESILANKERTINYWEQRISNEDKEKWRRSAPNMSEVASNDTGSRRKLYTQSLSLEASFKVESDVVKQVAEDKIEKSVAVMEMPVEKVEKIQKEIMVDKELSVQQKIVKELQELRQREEELRRLRRQQELVLKNKENLTLVNGSSVVDHSITTPVLNGDTFLKHEMEEVEEQDKNDHEEDSVSSYSSHEIVPDSPVITYHRADSIDSISSDHSSESDHFIESISPAHNSESEEMFDSPPTRKISVKPLEEPVEEDIVVFNNQEGETVIERDIRLTREREEALRREKGLQVHVEAKPTKVDVSLKVKTIDTAIANDPRSVQHRLATNRIQQEVNETSEREKELRVLGKILTTSEESVDAKVTRFTDLAESSIAEGKHKPTQRKMTRSQSTPSLDTVTSLSVTNQNVRKISDVNSKAYDKNTSQRGAMQRFILTGGLVTWTTFSSTKPKATPVPKKRVVVVTKPPAVQPVRKGYKPAESIIQEELREMKKRENELRQLRDKDQTNINSFDEVDMNEEHSGKSNLITRTDSNQPDVNVSKRSQRFRNPLIATWESKIASSSTSHS